MVPQFVRMLSEVRRSPWLHSGQWIAEIRASLGVLLTQLNIKGTLHTCKICAKLTLDHSIPSGAAGASLWLRLLEEVVQDTPKFLKAYEGSKFKNLISELRRQDSGDYIHPTIYKNEPSPENRKAVQHNANQ
eukprot:5258307-Amphidinium_carterae.1